MDAHIEERYGSETRRLVVRRGRLGATLFGLGVGMAGVLELYYHPNRLRYLVLSFALELAVCIVTIACFRARRLRRFGIGLTRGACLALVACVTLYGALTGANRAEFAFLFIVFELTTALMFPWGAGNQGIMAVCCMLAETSLVLNDPARDGALPGAYGLYAVTAAGLVSIVGAAFLDRQRRVVFRQREQLDQHLATFRDLTRTLHGFDPQRVLAVVCASTLETFRLWRLWVVWQTLGSGTVQGYLVRVTRLGVTWEPLIETRELWRWMAGWPSAEGAFLASSVEEDVPSVLRGAGATTMLCIPLGEGGERLGAICADRGGDPLAFTDRELALASVLASGAAIAMANAWLYQQVAAASEEKSVFLARIAHELRNPLQSILWDVDALHEHDDVRQTQRERLRQNALMTLDIAKELQDFAEVETQRLAPVPEAITLAQTFDNLEVTALPLLEGRPITFHATVDSDATVVVTDPFRLRQIIGNLISNAAKFTTRGTVELKAQRIGSDIAISVRDSGLGIEAADLARIFTPFYRGSARAVTGARGMGLGLAISQELATLLGGRLEVESVVGEGSIFRLLLPAADQIDASNPSAVEECPALSGAAVLLIDDDQSYRARAATTLRQRGAIVREASEGFEGLRRAREERPDLVVLDLGLPGLSGLQVLAHLKGDRELAEIPVVIATAEADLETRCRDAGCAGWILKPYSSIELLQVVTAALRDTPPKREPERASQ
jgi:signal transduction histidine kinase/ActR/RegA family two-component response regulator